MELDKPSDYKCLKGRYIVENVFAWMKNYKRIMMRHDCAIQKYLNFWYIGLTNLMSNKYSLDSNIFSQYVS